MTATLTPGTPSDWSRRSEVGDCVVPHSVLQRVLELLEHYADLEHPEVTDEDDETLAPRYWRRQAGTTFDQIEAAMRRPRPLH